MRKCCRQSRVPQAPGQLEQGARTGLLLFLFHIASTGAVALIETRRLCLSRRMRLRLRVPGMVVAEIVAVLLAPLASDLHCRMQVPELGPVREGSASSATTERGY